MSRAVPTSAFVTTRWTRVFAANGTSDDSRTALSELCDAYYRPVLAFLEHTGCGDADPRDVAHEFFAGLLAGSGIAANPDRGRFRTYLLAALKHHLANRRRNASRQRRGANAEHLPIGTPEDSGSDGGGMAIPPPAEAHFDREWALAVTERALASLEAEAARSGQASQYGILKPWLSLDGDPGSQAAAARMLGITEGALKVAIHRWRKRFRENVRAEVSQTLPPGGDLAGELLHLVEALA